jgi:hypothetical protein
MPVELCLCFQEMGLRGPMHLVLRVVNYVGSLLRRPNPSLWEACPDSTRSGNEESSPHSWVRYSGAAQRTIRES